MPVPPLPVGDFAAFQVFAEAAPAVTPPTATRPWRLADAVDMADDVAWACGVFGVVAGNPKSAALGRWLSIFGSEEWLNESRQAMRYLAVSHHQVLHRQAARYLADQATSYDGVPLAPAAVTRLNAWCEAMLAAFYADAAAQGRLFDPAKPPQPTDQPTTEPEIPPAPEGIKEERWQVIWKLYAEHDRDWRAAHEGRAPLRKEDMSPEVCKAIGVTREKMRLVRVAWREKNLKKSPTSC
jgi:hypothetical protein